MASIVFCIFFWAIAPTLCPLTSTHDAAFSNVKPVAPQQPIIIDRRKK